MGAGKIDCCMCWFNNYIVINLNVHMSMYNSSFTRRQSQRSEINYERHIEDLERKVDIILADNNKIREDNISLGKMIEQRDRELAYVTEQERKRAELGANDTFNNLVRELRLKDMHIDELTAKMTAQKATIVAELDSLNAVLLQASKQRERLEIQNEQLNMKLQDRSRTQDEQIRRLKENLQNQLYEHALEKQVDYKKEISSKEQKHLKEVEAIKKQLVDERTGIEEEKMNKLLEMHQKYEEDKEQIRAQLQQDFDRRIKQIETKANEKCRQVRDKSEEYIQSIVSNQKSIPDEYSDGTLKQQIANLKDSIRIRQQLIEELLAKEHQGQAADYYAQVQELRSRIKEITQHCFQESEMLKVKMAIQHQADVREVARAYESQVDILSSQQAAQQAQNQRLRTNYQQEVRKRMKLRQKFEVDSSKMKNIIRKMKMQLEGYGKQLRLNIEGMKSQANSLSMSIIGEMGQQTAKKAFYEQEIRKLQQIIETKDSEVETVNKQCEQKVRFYTQKCEAMKRAVKEYQQLISTNQDRHQEQILDERRKEKNQTEKQRTHLLEEIQHLKDQLVDSAKKLEEFDEKIMDLNSDKSVLQKEITEKQHEIQFIKADIEVLRLERDMGEKGFAAQSAFSPMKNHYERVIQEIQKDKENLQSINSAQADQLARIVAKYKSLEGSMGKTLTTLQKRKMIDAKVMELGMDNNLVKNLSQIFRNQSPEDN